MRRNGLRAALAAALAAGLCGCMVQADSPLVSDRLKLVSAGHTGCAPDENVLSNVKATSDGSGMWNATCRGRTYLCTAVVSVGNSESFSCAPVAQ